MDPRKIKSASITIELEGQPFAPILDVQENIRRLVDLSSKSVFTSYDFTPFGELIAEHHQWSAWSLLGYTNPSNPWRFASKRLDPELDLIYYGKMKRRQ